METQGQEAGGIVVDLSAARKTRKPRVARCAKCQFSKDNHPGDHAFEEKIPKARAPRRANDAYGTVDDLALGIVQRVTEIHYVPGDEAILEPTVGEGPFIRACRKVYGDEPKIAGVDLVDYREKVISAGANLFVQQDILAVDPKLIARFSMIIGNPPFTSAAKIIDFLHRAAPRAFIFFLLPVSFFGGTEERSPEFAKLNPIEYFAPIWPRPSFTGNGKTDRMEYGLFGFGGAISDVMDSRKLGDPIIWKPSKWTPIGATEELP